MSKPFSKGLFLFSHDLRLHDQAALRQASLFCERLVCVFCIDDLWFKETYLGSRPMGTHRFKFLLQSLKQLNEQLVTLGQQLHIYRGNSQLILENLIVATGIDAVYSSHQASINAARQWQSLSINLPHCHFSTTETHRLFCQSQHLWLQGSFPKNFEVFKQLMKNQMVDSPTATITELPHAFPVPAAETPVNLSFDSSTTINGGELIGLDKLGRFFKHGPQYIQGINDNSLSLSPWLANGSLSVKTLFARLAEQRSIQKKSGHQPGALGALIKSTQQKLWRREYLQCYAAHQKNLLLSDKGINKKNPLTSFYPSRFKQWCNGNTP